MNTTHKIVKMTRGLTSGSRSPMWRCETEDGQRVNVFKHYDPNKNSFRFFEDAGYAVEMLALATDESLIWRTTPVAVQLEKTPDGKWWEIIAVAARNAGDLPDKAAMPDVLLYRQAVHRWAQSLLTFGDRVVVWDTETTGTNDDDEIIEIAAVTLGSGQTLLNTRICPVNLEKVANTTDIHSISPDELLDCPAFPSVYPEIRRHLDGVLWSAYNASFDTDRLYGDCTRHNLAPIMPPAITDVMAMFSIFNGEWNFNRQQWVSKGLQFAAQHLGIDVTGAHAALDDALTTRRLIHALAEYSEPF
jgi:DNA polymerase III epsilon subunit-like protein